MLHIIKKTSFNLLTISLLALPLAACDIGKAYIDNNAFSGTMSSNAVFIGYRDGNDLQVSTITDRNTTYAPSTKTFLVKDDNKRYTFIFACPSANEAVAHKVFFYYTTVGEVNKIEHLCRKPEEDFLRSVVYGQITDVNINQNEKVFLSLDGGASYQQTREAYAAEIVLGSRDFMAMKVGKNVGTQEEEANAFAIARRVSVVSGDPRRNDLSFTAGANGPLTTATRIPPDSTGMVYVSDIPSSNKWAVEVGFRTEFKTYLRLAESVNNQFQYPGVPKYISYINSNNQLETLNELFRKDVEGHEVTGKVFDANDRLIGQTKQFFADAQDVDVRLPVTPASGAALVSDNSSTINLSWPSFTSLPYGRSTLYHWVIKGVPNDAVRTSALDPVIEQLEWHVYVTPGWVNSGGTQSLQLSLSSISVPPVIVQDEVVETWKREWNFKAGSSFRWQLDNFSSEGPAQDLLYYLTHGDYVESMKFSQNIQYDM